MQIVKVLEEILWSKIGTKQEYQAEYGKKPLVEFVREIVGLDMNAAKNAFAEYLDGNPQSDRTGQCERFGGIKNRLTDMRD